jgi:hypothetical protein
MSAAGVEAITKPPLTDDIVFKPLDRIYGTIFLNEFARDQGRGSWLDLAELAEKIRGVERASKHHLPWIKLAWFGDIPSAKNCLRYDQNVQLISGIECDIDGKGTGIEDAARKLSGLRALLYSTPSSTPAKPHYRVLCPLSGAYSGPPDVLRDLRARLVARVNHMLGGIVADESFVLSQSYYFGNVEGRPPIEIIVSEPKIPIDWVDECGVLFKSSSREPPKKREPQKPAKKREPQGAPEGLIENDHNPVLLAEAARRVRWHVAKHGAGTQPRGSRALALGSWLADMRTTTGQILSFSRIAEIMQTVGDYGEIDLTLFEQRLNRRGCQLVLGAVAEARKHGWVK